MPMDEVLGDIATSLARGGWLFTIASLLTLIAAGAAVRTARRLARRSAPELIVLLNQSAAFYRRWPDDRLSSAPRGELVTGAGHAALPVEPGVRTVRNSTVTSDSPSPEGFPSQVKVKESRSLGTTLP